MSITIVERSPSPRINGQSIDIRGPAVDIIKKMNLEEAIRSRYTTEEGTVFLNPSGKTVAEFPAGDIFTADYEILRADLSELFLRATESLRNIQYIYGDYIQALEQTEKNINVTLNKGSKETYDLVVAADGGLSKTRSMILDDHVTQGSYNFLGQYLAYFTIPSQANEPKTWNWYNTQKGLCIMTRPHRNPGTKGAYLCITMPARGERQLAIEDALDKGSDEAKKRILHKYFDNAGWQAEQVLDGLDKSTDFYMSRAAQVKLPKWTSGRACVLGDAAHATFGVGTTLAIEGAYLLAGELSKIQNSEDIPQALVSFEDVFRPLYGKMEDPPSWFPQAAFPQTGWGLWLRNTFLWFVSTTKIYKLSGPPSEEKQNLPQYAWVDL